MPLEESFPAEVAEAPVSVAEAAIVAAEAPAVVETVEAPPAATEAPQEASETAPPAPAEVPPVEAPAFDPKDWLKKTLGDDAPETPEALKERLESYKANQVTDAQKAQLAILDPANADKFKAYAELAGKDYDKIPFGEAMRARFALDNPGMDDELLEYEFSREFARKYPTLAAAIASPDDYQADDPQVLIEKKAADFAANKDRIALKANQQTAAEALFAEARAAQASTAPQHTPAQIADAQAVVKWSDETFKDGYALPLDVGNGQKYNYAVGDAASFKEGFFNTPQLYEKLTRNEDGTINRENQALAVAFLRDPKAFIGSVYAAGKGSGGPALPIDELTNSSARPAARPAAASAAVSSANHPAYVAADDWHNSNA